ncbi:MAG: hypothetical protein R2850_00060 [Bacteroidia bacterium]
MNGAYFSYDLNGLHKDLNRSLAGEQLEVLYRQPANGILQISLSGILTDKAAIRFCEFVERLSNLPDARQFNKIYLTPRVLKTLNQAPQN